MENKDINLYKFGKCIHAARCILHHSTVLSFRAPLKPPRNRLAMRVKLKNTWENEPYYLLSFFALVLSCNSTLQKRTRTVTVTINNFPLLFYVFAFGGGSKKEIFGYSIFCSTALTILDSPPNAIFFSKFVKKKSLPK